MTPTGQVCPCAPGDRGLWVKSKSLNQEEFVVVGTDPEEMLVSPCRRSLAGQTQSGQRYDMSLTQATMATARRNLAQRIERLLDKIAGETREADDWEGEACCGRSAISRPGATSQASRT
jgi:hypothetical protein